MVDCAELGVAEAELRLVRDILARLAPGVRVLAFGSRVQGRARRFSDLDLALDARAPIDLGRMGALRRAFSDSDLPWRVDLVDMAAASPTFQEIIQRRHLVLQEGDGGFDTQPCSDPQ